MRAATPRALLAAWYLPLAAGLAPLLLVGFLTSALANRLVFLLWALAAAALHAALLRGALGRHWGCGQGRGWRLGAVAAVVLAGLAVSFAAYAALLVTHGEILDLGLRAVAPGLAGLAPVLAAPGTALAVAALLAAAGAAAALAGLAGRSGRARGGRLA